MKKELHIAATSNQRVTIKLHGGEVITGVAEVCNDHERAKVRTSEGPVWVPYAEVKHVSRLINMINY